MKYKVLVLDIDGTLTNSKKEITPDTKQALIKLMESGIKVVLASGRPVAGIQPIAEQLELKKYGGYILAFNGARIIESNTDTVIHDQTLPINIIPKLYDLSKEYNVNILSYDKDAIISEIPDDKYLEIEARINKMPIRKVDSFKQYIDYPVNKCLITGDGEYLAEVEKNIKDRLEGEITVYRSEAFFLECVPLNIDKATSLDDLLRYLGYTKEEMIACGDGYNDISMIEYAGLGVAMANAKDEVKKVADFITLSNDDEGITHVINKFFD